MDEAKFWSLIDASVEASPPQEVQERRLAAALGQLPAEDVAAFDTMFWMQVGRAYSWDLWRAAYIIHGGASDDGFEYFRRWLISRGRATFEAALRDPDSLADLIPASQSEPRRVRELSLCRCECVEVQDGRRPLRRHGRCWLLQCDVFRECVAQ